MLISLSPKDHKHCFIFYHIKLLTGVFVDEWNGMIKFNNFKATPKLQFRMFKKDVVIEFRGMVTASLEAYFSLGGKVIYCVIKV